MDFLQTYHYDKALLLARNGMRAIRVIRADRRGVTALEYGIIASILGLVLVGIFKSFGSTLSHLFTAVGSSI